jgi:hypothetical protein
MPAASVFRGVLVFFIGQPKHIVRLEYYLSRLNATKPRKAQASYEAFDFVAFPRQDRRPLGEMAVLDMLCHLG